MRLHWPLLSLLLLFLIPLISAACLLRWSDLHALPKKNYGALVEPAQQISINNMPADHIWHVVYVEPPVCEENCKQQQRRLHNLHLALGAERERVSIINSTPTMLKIDVEPDSMLIVNPHSMYIMYYAPGTELSGLLKDLKRLLKYSHV